MTSVVVSDGGGNIVEYVTVVDESQQVRVAAHHLSVHYIVLIFTGTRSV